MENAIKPDPQRYTREGRNWRYTEIHGRKVYSVRTLLDAAHQVGLVEIDTIEFFHDPEAKIACHKAIVRFADGTKFSGYGDARPDNVNRSVLPHYYRVSETRAIGRALAFALNVDANLQEEFSGSEEDIAQENQSEPEGPWYCENCGREITDSRNLSAKRKVELSLKQTGRVLCYNCRPK